ncbi:MAG TPA: hypothetical protein PLW86_14105, partial [Rhodocyclaceae bacterium]|nr:hypothetical protein [Rhodocyclaceae bacterium]
MKRIYLSILVVLSLFLVACATPTHMAFSDDAEAGASKDAKPVFLMTATVRNKYRTSFQPKVFVAHVERAVVKDSADRINFRI